jgi:hypothetical protein
MLADDAAFGFGVDRFLFPVEGVLRDPRDLGLGAPGCFLSFPSSAGSRSCAGSSNAICIVSSGGVCVCEADAVSGTAGGREGGSGGGLASAGSCWC